MPRPPDLVGRERFIARYERDPAPDAEIAADLGEPRSTIAHFRNQIGLPPVGRCQVCRTAIGSRQKHCPEHAKSKAAGKGDHSFRDDLLRGTALLALHRRDPAAYKVEARKVRDELGARQFKRRLGWVERCIERERRHKAEGRVMHRPAEAELPVQPEPPAPAPEVRPDEPPPQRRSALSAFDEPPTTPQRRLDAGRPVVSGDDYMARHRATCEDLDCECGAAQKPAAARQPVRPATVQASRSAQPPPAGAAKGKGPFDGPVVVLRHRLRPPPPAPGDVTRPSQ